MDKIHKLSDAIRLGATFHPQCRNMYVSLSPSGLTVEAACALGGAGLAVGMEPREVNSTNIMYRFPDVPIRVIGGSVDANDKLGWSREEIADWVASEGY